jgi:hypothetical protein
MFRLKKIEIMFIRLIHSKWMFSDNEKSHYIGPFAEKAKFKTPQEEYDYNVTQTKPCKKCKRTLDLNCYAVNTSGTDPFDRKGYRLKRGECIDCGKKISESKRASMKLAKQMGMSKTPPEGTVCELCGSNDKIVFDHHHEKGIFRGWLCNGCNRSIGMLGENIESLVKSVNYMNKFEKKNITFDKETYSLKVEEESIG